MPKPAQSDDDLPVAIYRDGGSLILRDVLIDDSHCMGFEPCLHLECSKCGLSLKHNAEELKEFCTEDLT